MKDQEASPKELPEVLALDERVLVHLVAGNPTTGTTQGGVKLMGEMLSNVSKTRSEISMTFARNSRA